MRMTADAYFLIKTSPAMTNAIAKQLKSKGFDARITSCAGSPCDIIFFTSLGHNRRGSTLHSEIKGMAGVTQVLMLTAYPVN